MDYMTIVYRSSCGNTLNETVQASEKGFQIKLSLIKEGKFKIASWWFSFTPYLPDLIFLECNSPKETTQFIDVNSTLPYYTPWFPFVFPSNKVIAEEYMTASGASVLTVSFLYFKVHQESQFNWPFKDTRVCFPAGKRWHCVRLWRLLHVLREQKDQRLHTFKQRPSLGGSEHKQQSHQHCVLQQCVLTCSWCVGRSYGARYKYHIL